MIEKRTLTFIAGNMPCELPKVAREGFGDMFLDNIIPAFFNGEKTVFWNPPR